MTPFSVNIEVPGLLGYLRYIFERQGGKSADITIRNTSHTIASGNGVATIGGIAINAR